MTSQLAYFIPPGGGPCFFMKDPRGAWAINSVEQGSPVTPRLTSEAAAQWKRQIRSQFYQSNAIGAAR